MRIEKQESIVLTFNTTTDAMNFEKKAQEAEVPGRLIPVPSSISAGCGLAWMSRKKDETSLQAFLEESQLKVSGQHEIML